MDAADSSKTPPIKALNLSPKQRTLLRLAAAAILLPQLVDLPGALSCLREGWYDMFFGFAFSLILTTVFAIQLLRGRWLMGTCCFLLFAIAVAVFKVASPTHVASLHRLTLVHQIPFIVTNAASLAIILYVRHLSNRDDRGA